MLLDTVPEDGNLILYVDTCYAQHWCRAAEELARNNRIPDKVRHLKIFAFSAAENTLEWGEAGKLFKNYKTKGGRFYEQGDAWKELFDRHVNTYGFGHFSYSRYRK